MRADYNVPIADGKIEDDYRITQSIPTLRALIEQNCKIVIVSHLGRPKGRVVDELSLKPVAKRLTQLLNQEVHFVGHTIGKKALSHANSLRPGQILLVENFKNHCLIIFNAISTIDIRRPTF